MNWSKIKLKTRLVITGAMLTIIPLMALSVFVVMQEHRMEDAAAEACQDLALADLDHTAKGIYSLCATLDTMQESFEAQNLPVPPEGMAELRAAVMNTEVGRTGYVYVLDSRGNYVISKGGKRDGENIWNAKDATGRHFIRDICRKGAALRPGEIGEDRYPWKNEGDDEARIKIARIIYYEPWDWVIGVGSYMEEFEAAERNVAAISRENVITLAISACAAAFLAIGIWWLLASGIARTIGSVTLNLDTAAIQVSSAADQIAQTSQQTAESASEQAAGLEELTANLQEISGVIEQNATSASRTNEMTDESESSAKQGVTSLTRMQTAISDIKESSNETAKILKTIDEIAFQTNLLALNAAVEAARAGDAGKGFAVVAEEVRNLAQRSAEAAKNTAALIETSQANAENGVKVTEEVEKIFGNIVESVGEVSKLVHEVTVSSNEQSRNFDQINSTMSQMDTVTQSNAASAEESAASSEELSGQANELQDMVAELYEIVNGAGSRQAHGHTSTCSTAGRSGPAARAVTSHGSSAGTPPEFDMNEDFALDNDTELIKM
ncbi:MAG: methyl-accepting chemotaxis protein [bacterium]|nr:methyl-accepting chemotaxis protein [bacterium]